MQAKQFLLLLFPIVGFADVNMRDASYIHHVNEFTHPIFTKTYNSRSLYSGTFGFGWCTEFEKTLSPRDGTRYHCGKVSQVPLKARKNTWVLDHPNGLTEIYNSDGQLISIKKSDQPLVLIYYNSKKKIQSIHYQRKKFIFEYDSKLEQIKNITEESKKPIQYFFKNQNLVEIRQAQNQTHFFEYDEFHNLTLAHHSSRKIVRISYDNQSDEVQKIQTANGCTENYQFQQASATELKSTVDRSCPSSPLQKKSFSFTARKTTNGSLVLSQVKITGALDEKLRLP